MNLPYLKLSHEEAISAKRSLLYAQISILNLIKNLNSYRKIRKLELVNKSKLRASVKQNISRINSLLNEMPIVKGEEKFIHHEPIVRPIRIRDAVPIKKKVEEKPVKKKRTIETELQEIQAKLASLS